MLFQPTFPFPLITSLILMWLMELSSCAPVLGPIFSSGMILQTWDIGDSRSFVYGKSSLPSVPVTLTLTSMNSTFPDFSRVYETVSDSDDSTFAFQIDGTYMPDDDGNVAPHYGPFRMEVGEGAGENKIVYDDVFFGDVYICAGDDSMSTPTFAEVWGDGAVPSGIRRYKVPENGTEGGSWMSGSDEVDNFSAFCLHAAKELRNLDPAGTGIGNQTGGETMPIGVIQITSDGRSGIDDWSAEGGNIFDRLVSPLSELAVRGVFFSQGSKDAEDESTTEEEYGKSLTEGVISGWRDSGVIGDYSFSLVQHGGKGGGEGNRAVRLGQAAALPRSSFLWGSGDELTESKPVCTTTVVPTYDCYDDDSVEMRAKRAVLGMVHTSYAKQEPEWGWSVPIAKTFSIVDEGLEVGFSGEQSLSATGSDCGESVRGYFGPNDGWVSATTAEVTDGNKMLVKFQGWPVEKVTKIEVAPVGSEEDCVIKNQNGVPALTMVVEGGAGKGEVIINKHEVVPKTKTKTRTKTNYTSFHPPPMGFNTWNRYHCWVSESLLKRTVDKMVELGLVAAGYSFLNVDDCWQSKRNSDGTIYVDETRFPSGLKALGDYVHANNMSYGLYTSQSELTCQARPGSYLFEVEDSNSYCEADADYLKIDHCGGVQYKEGQNVSWVKFRSELDICAEKRDRKFWTACSSCGPTKCLVDGTCTGIQGCGKYVVSSGCDIWRTTTDIQARWSSIMYNLDINNLMAPVQNSNPGHFNDPDMLQVGNIGLTVTEQKSHFALWALMGGPLLISTELAMLTDTSLQILTNKGLIEWNQDALVKQGVRIGTPGGDVEVWAKELSGERVGVVLLNRKGTEKVDITLEFDELPVIKEEWTIKDVWSEENMGLYHGQFIAKGVDVHGHVALLLT